MLAPLLQAVRDELRKTLRPLNIKPDSVQVTRDEKVPADSGQVFVGVYAVDMSPTEVSGNAVLCSELAVAIGVTVRSREIPVDRRGENLYTDIGDLRRISIDETIQRILRTLHGQPTIIQKATKLGSKLGLAYCEPLFLARSIGNPEEKDKAHFNVPEADGDVGYNEDDFEGLYQEAVFIGAKCFQSSLDFEPILED
jgi:hypothetical protein